MKGERLLVDFVLDSAARNVNYIHLTRHCYSTMCPSIYQTGVTDKAHP